MRYRINEYDNIILLTPEIISQNLRTIHTSIVEECLLSYKPNPIFSCRAPEINKPEQTLHRCTRRALAQHRSGKFPMLQEYLHKINPSFHPSTLCPLYKLHDHSTKHLFTCPMIQTSLTPGDLYDPTLWRWLTSYNSGQTRRGQLEVEGVPA